MLSKHRVTFSLAIAAFILIFGAIAIFWARGFKPDLRNGGFDRTGLLVASSIPTGAQVYLDDRFTSATDTTITYLDPKTYKLKIEKDGYTRWEKSIEIKADLATEVKALLFPLAPEIKPLTTTGANNPTLSPDGGKIVYGVSGERGGAYTLSMNTSPFPFKQDVKLLAKNRAGFDFSKATFTWSPDSEELIAHFETTGGQAAANILIDANDSDQDLRDITGALTATLNTYQQGYITLAQTLAITAPQEVKDATAAAQTASPAPSPKTSPTTQPPNVNCQLSIVNCLIDPFPTGMIFSPSEEKILYKNKENRYKVYDLKTKKEFTLPEFPDFINISWYPDSDHLVVAQNPPAGGQISIIEVDGTNKVTVYSGKFENACPPEAIASGDCGRGFVFAHPSGTKLIILTTLTQPEGNPANLYSINLR